MCVWSGTHTQPEEVCVFPAHYTDYIRSHLSKDVLRRSPIKSKQICKHHITDKQQTANFMRKTVSIHVEMMLIITL